MTDERYDVVILGSGPAGLQAAIHAGRRKASVLVLGRLPRSSSYNAHIENFCCLHGDTGAELLKQAHLKAEESGAKFLEQDVTEITMDNGRFSLQVESGRHLDAAALIFAMGISRKKLGLKGEKNLLGRGISYCVDCDAGFYKGEAVAMIGCESAALTGALTLLLYAKEVHLICDKPDATDVLIEKIRESPIQLHESRKVAEILGDESVTGLELDDGARIDVGGVFIELGAKGATMLAGALGVALDKDTMKYIATNKKQETNVPGVYAAGDICGPPWQVAKAIGEGCVAGLEAAAYAKKLRNA
ncbi:MAG: NAD(P)/FAD-dependent oxidoreductase [Deltaproteobacteria bacterium]|nr:NAD(P)/FAD-dependent oxidoreductase [Deltaproteobacteria bacterium]